MFFFSTSRSRFATARGAWTLVELLVVLVVLLALAGVVVPMFSDFGIGREGARKSLQEFATEQTLLKVRDAILGAPGQKGYWPDLGEHDTDNLPEKLSDLLNGNAPPGVPANLQTYNPNTRLGWRGPYLQSIGARYGRTDFYGLPDDSAVLDGWGEPLVLQFPNTAEPDRSRYVRLVSAGPNRALETPRDQVRPEAGELTRALCGDDVLLFLRVPDTRP